MFNSCKSQFLEKDPVLPIEKFLFLVPARNTMMLQLIIHLSSSIICQVVAYGWLKTKESFELLAIKVVSVTYERWSLTRGLKYSDLTWETFGILENWSLRRGGLLREVVATGGSTVV